MDAITHPPAPVNEPNLTYAPGSPERAALELELKRQEDRQLELTATIGGVKKMGGGAEIAGRAAPRPRPRARRADELHPGRRPGRDRRGRGTRRPEWAAMSFDDRAAVLLKAADLLAGPWRQRLNAATMLGQSKTAFQAEIDSACELDRLLALQRALRAGRSWPSSRSRTPAASGTAPTTGRSRASSTRSRRSTSPRSPATCRRRRR